MNTLSTELKLFLSKSAMRNRAIFVADMERQPFSLECRTEISPNKNEKSGMYLIIKAHEKMCFWLKDTPNSVYLFEFIDFVCVLAITGIVFGLFLYAF